MGIKRDFADAYAGKVGTVAGGDGEPVELSAITLSLFCGPERAAEYGCPAGQLAILAEWSPAELVPDQSVWMTFPRTFDGTPVYYKRGAILSR